MGSDPDGTPRVVSLVPSVTETLLAWGVTPVACTRFCEQPDIAHVGGTKNPDVAAVVALRPDLVVMEREENRLDDHAALEAAGVATEVLHVTSLDDVGPETARLAARLAELGAALSPDAGTALASGPAPTGRGVRTPGVVAFVPIWRRPWMTVNRHTYGASLLARLGVTVAFADEPQRYPEVTARRIAAAAPDVVLAPTEPYPFKPRHLAELEQFAPAHLVDGRDLFWWGARTPAALRRLAVELDEMEPGR
ncbi:MAG TPA: cobalamin-binding protein [Acidimicrobiaceae bacterium]|nr:cobalamin-binding protein [Acidimicrobiaceae bacterium]HCB36666.1 cobalamin-binding protein [Acidimicrobiaceae bacterium]